MAINTLYGLCNNNTNRKTSTNPTTHTRTHTPIIIFTRTIIISWICHCIARTLMSFLTFELRMESMFVHNSFKQNIFYSYRSGGRKTCTSKCRRGVNFLNLEKIFINLNMGFGFTVEFCFHRYTHTRTRKHL